MERINSGKMRTKPGGGLKDTPRCERCGRPVRVRSDDFDREEILCPTCASEHSYATLDESSLSRD